MTNELEKQFFDTFGIEPKYESHSCDGWGRTVEVKYFTDKKEADKFGMVLSELEYPQITDSILLELICILNENTTLDETYYQGASTVKELKKLVLKDLIKTKDNFDTIHQVRTLFEER